MQELTAASGNGPADRPVHQLVLLVAGRCNLACSYCAQERGRVRARMPWTVARTAIDRLFAMRPAAARIVFSGGEPLLAVGLVRRCLAYVERARPPDCAVETALATNGLLLTVELARELADRGVHLQVSCDGVEAAQRHRGAGSFARVDATLRALARETPEVLDGGLSVALTVHGAALGHLADSVRYLLELGVHDLVISPLTGPDPDWGEGSEAELRRQVDGVVALTQARWERTGKVAVAFLRAAPDPVPRGADGALCAAGSPTSFAVDPDGSAWGCSLAAASLQRLSASGRAAAGALDLGDVRAVEFPDRLRALPARAARVASLVDRPTRRSSWGACCDCPWLPRCTPCPAGLWRDRERVDPDLVHGHVCAFTRVTAAAGESFRREIAGARLLREMGATTAALHDLAATWAADSQ